MDLKKREYKKATDMPIYKKTYELLISIVWIMKKMDRDFKHTIGQRMVNIVLEMLGYLSDSYLYSLGKEYYVRRYISLLYQLQQLLKLCSDDERAGIKAIRRNDYVNIMPILASAERQAIGWFHSLEEERNNKSPEFVNESATKSEVL